ncbi:MAG: hypothetical protein ACKOXO_06285 [Cyanobium sp.]
MGSPIDLATFLARAHSRFGDRYDYGAIVYKSYKTPIRIRCREHPVRDIVITPEKHLQTTGGCKFCLRVSRVRLLERQFSIADATDHPVASAPERRRAIVNAPGPNPSGPNTLAPDASAPDASGPGREAG